MMEGYVFVAKVKMWLSLLVAIAVLHQEAAANQRNPGKYFFLYTCKQLGSDLSAQLLSVSNGFEGAFTVAYELILSAETVHLIDN